MGVLNSASLVVTPNGYKANKLYSVIPTDGSGDMTFTRAGDTATRVNASGLIETVLANKPRLDYTSSTCPKLLMEPQRTNLTTYSNTFTNAAWAKTRCSVLANTTVSPDGTTNASSLIEDTSSSSTHYFYNANAVVIGTTYTYSIFAKANTRSKIWLNINSTSANATSGAIFNLANGTVESVQSGATANIVGLGNGWFRCSYTQTATIALYGLAGLYSTSSIYTGDGVSGIYIYGGQLEAGTYPTSYIPTTTATVTRNADVFSKSEISSLLNSQAGTFVAFISPLKGNTGDLGGLKIDDSTNASNYVTIQFRDSPINVIAGSYRLNGTAVSYAQANNTNLNGITKVAYVYQNGSQKLFINGALVGSSTATISNSVIFDRVTSSAPASGVGAFYGNIHVLSVFKTALSDLDAIALTTL